MAIGDIGAAHGFPAVASTQSRALGYQDVNQVQDYLGTEVDNRVAGDALAVKKANFTVQPAATALPSSPTVGDIVVQY